MPVRKIAIIIAVILSLSLGGFFYFRYQVYFYHPAVIKQGTFIIQKGEGNGVVASRLKEEGWISGKLYFYYYLRTHGLLNKILPGEYALTGNMTILDIAIKVTSPRDDYTRITFPEGFTAKEVADRLTENGFDGATVLSLINDPDHFRDRYDFLANLQITSLEGFLFPDTYFFKPDDTPEKLINRMLDDFSRRITPDLIKNIKAKNHTMLEMLTLASILEKEVKSPEDRLIVSGIFWNRIALNMPIQSDATLSYILDDNKVSHSGAELQINSPYNTYINKGLPPGPINNPGLDAIEAAINPQKTDYLFFLSDPLTGQTLFAKTFEEHSANKAKSGL